MRSTKIVVLMVLGVYGLFACGGNDLSGIGEVGNQGDQLLDSVLISIVVANDIPALGVIAVGVDSVRENGVSGFRAERSAASVLGDDRWHMGSLTKAMTATLAARLVEAGVINWATTVAEVFPDFVGTILPEYETVRLDELLSHTSGLPADITQTPLWPTLRSDPAPLPDQRRRWSAELLSLTPAGERELFVYTNAGYVVAGAMLEERTGQAWEQLMQEEVFDPLGMTTAGFGPPGSLVSPPDQPRGHVRSSDDAVWTPLEPDMNADNPAALGPAGTVHVSLPDYANFVQEHLRGMRASTSFLTAASWDKLHTAVPGSGSALGWGVDRRTWANGQVLAHSGSNTFWFAVVWMAPEREMAFVAVTNVGGTVGEHSTDQAIQALILRAGFSF